jgi:hypothetical protein
MTDVRLDRLKLVILPGKPGFGFLYGELHDTAYRFWLAYWTAVRRDIGLPETVSADDFLRHDFVNVLVDDGSVVAMLNSTLLDFGRVSAANHSYLNTYFGEGFLAALRSMGLNRMATLENIVADLHWRRAAARDGVSLGAVMTALALQQAREAGCDGAFGAARADVPTARIAYDLGARAVVRGCCFHGKTTDLVAWSCQEIRAHPAAAVRQTVERLWAGRLDTSRSETAELCGVEGSL